MVASDGSFEIAGTERLPQFRVSSMAGVQTIIVGVEKKEMAMRNGTVVPQLVLTSDVIRKVMDGKVFERRATKRLWLARVKDPNGVERVVIPEGGETDLFLKALGVTDSDVMKCVGKKVMTSVEVNKQTKKEWLTLLV